MGATLAAWAGLLFGMGSAGSEAAIALGLMAPCALYGWRGSGSGATLAALIALALAAVARGDAHRVTLEAARGYLADSERLYRIEGEVIAPPDHESGERFVTLAVQAAEPSLMAGTRIRLRLPPETEAEWSDRLRALARLEIPPNLRNPGGGSARAFADAAGVAANGRAFVARSEPAEGPDAWPRVTLARWRRAIERRFARLSGEARELVVPLVIGDRSALSPELNGRLRTSGLIHLLALSGLHVTWMAAIARSLVASLGGTPRARELAGGLAGIVYLGLAGPLPSLARATATEVIRALARAFSRIIDPLQALSLSALGLLLCAPGWASDLGFQLSCAATLGLVAIGPTLGGKPGGWNLLRRSLAPTLSAQLTATPLLLARFHAISWVAPFSNLVAVPIAGLLLAAAWLAIAIDLVAPGAGNAWFGACEVLAHALRVVSEASARAPSALLSSGAGAGVALLAGVGAALIAAGWSGPRDLDACRSGPSRARDAARMLGTWASALSLLLAATERPLLPEAGKHWLVVLDVGQGDALALGFPDGWWLVDAGPRSPRYDAGESVVLPFFRWAGVRRLESLVITHGDGDHEGGAGAVVRGLPVTRRLGPPSFPAVPGPRERLGGIAIAAGDRLREEPPVRVLWPPRPHSSALGVPIRSDNEASVVLEVGAGEGRLLLLADVDSTIEARLPVDSAIAVLKVAHHGSGSSSGITLLGRARPRVAAISCGRRNPFGHPALGAIERLEGAGAAIDRTDLAGALWYEADPGGIRRIDWRRDDRLDSRPR